MTRISHNQMQMKKTDPKVNEALRKAMVDLEKKYDRPENCNLLKVPWVNKEIWDALNKQAHSVALTLQVIPKSLVTGMIPFVQMADMLENKKELEPKIKKKINKKKDVGWFYKYAWQCLLQCLYEKKK